MPSPKPNTPFSFSADSQLKQRSSDSYFFRHPRVPLAQRRLTRQRKLRHLSNSDIGLRFHSSPDSPESNQKSPSSASNGSDHWSSSAVPQPLPLPGLSSLRTSKCSDVKTGHCLNGSPVDEGSSSATRRDQCSSNSAKSPSKYRQGFAEDLNLAKVDYNLRLNVSARSAPTSGFSSPAISPRKSKMGNFFHSFVAPNELSSPNYSPLHSPTMQSPKVIEFPWHNNLEKADSNSHVNAHPLPLPPGVFMPSPSANSIQYSSDKPDSMTNQWQKGKLIGRGTFGSVYIATHRETGALCAMKEVDLVPDDSKSAECIKQLEQEIKVLRQLNHPNIVRYYGSEIIDNQFYIFLEYIHPGSITKYIREHCKAITESVVRSFTRHILSGLAYLHSTKTIHRDIKGANLLVDASGIVKLADFGMAKHLTGKTYELSLKGSPYWMAPEVMQAAMQKDTKADLAYAVDIWSLGCTIIEMLNGKPPWSELEGPQAMFKVLHKTPPLPETLSSEGKDFLTCCFQRNPAERPSAVTLLDHPFVRNSHNQNITFCTQAFCGMNLMDKHQSPSPRSCATHKIDKMAFPFGKRIMNGNL